jgi:amino acid adenylation domain-containing protein
VNPLSNVELGLDLKRRALFEKLLQQERAGSTSTSAIARRATGGSAPLSFAQERLWFLDRLQPGNSAYSVPMAIGLAGPLNVAALERSLNEIVRRHEVLRTAFSFMEAQPVQVIAAAESLRLPLIDLQGLPDTESEARRLAAEEALRPFDLARGPLVRTRLLRLGEQEHVLLLPMHHIVSDGWSLGVLFRELSVLYENFSSGKPSPLPELPIQYADFAVWQRQWLQGEVLEGQLSYWKKQLAAAPAALDLPTDRPRSPVQTFHGARQSVGLSQALTNRLKALCHRESVTLFVTLLAAFQTLLHRYTSHDDIVVGSPIAGRTRTEIEGLIGLFVNTLALRTDLSGDPSFRELLGRVREVALEAYAHQDLPFEKLVEQLQPERDLSRSPLLQVIFVLQNAPMTPLRLSGLTVTPLKVESKTAKFDLTLSLVEKTDTLTASVEYSTDLFDAATIGRMLGHFQTLLEGIVANPDQRLSDLPLLTEAERHQLLVEWNDTKTDYPANALIHELFEAQAARTPEAMAVEYEGRQLNYRELNARANQVAHYLARHGVGPEVVVGICVERSLEMVVGVLGILKAGGAYVPLDPDYPAARLSFMLEDTAAPVLLTQAGLRDRLPAFAGRVVALDADWREIAREGEENPKVKVGARNLAYVIYTSGSTGRPKGTCIEHRSVVRLVQSTNYVELGPQEVFLQFAPISFDASTLELWGSLLNGAKLVVCPAGLLSLQELGRVIKERGVSTLWLTAALFHQMVDEQIESLRGVRQILAGGETLSASHVRRMLEVIGAGRLINGYGPTENTTFTCCHVMTAQSRIEHTVPIGRPISNTRVYVLDRHMRPVPVGVYGELCIGGAGLAREYLHQPQLTAEKFVPDPFSGEAGARLYRSGDLVRYLADGTIEFVGRIDYQVKIRGFRIELGEIEAGIARHPAIREVVVLAREDAPGDKRLVAYVVAANLPADLVDQLRSHLRASLPEHMVPAHFVTLEALPLTLSGKVDREALPAPGVGDGASHTGAVAPRTATEEMVMGVFRGVLERADFGVLDSFFDLGGHSLMAARLMARLRTASGIDLPLRNLFESPTVAGMAEAIDALSWSAKPKALTGPSGDREEIEL